jgi:hydroxyquinol 1,2-dioxygenase
MPAAPSSSTPDRMPGPKLVELNPELILITGSAGGGCDGAAGDGWNRAIAFLTDAGHITDDKREEFVLLSDVLGASMQTVAVNNTAYKNATEATVFGPFFAEGAPLHRAGRRHVGRGGRAAEGAGNGDRHRWHPAARCSYRGVAGRREGFLRRPIRRQSGSRARPPLRRREWWSLILGAHAHPPYPIPDDGPVGKMLTAVGRAPMRAAHLHFMVAAEN